MNITFNKEDLEILLLKNIVGRKEILVKLQAVLFFFRQRFNILKASDSFESCVKEVSDILHVQGNIINTISFSLDELRNLGTYNGIQLTELTKERLIEDGVFMHDSDYSALDNMIENLVNSLN